jgi:hypothetical protein
MLEKNKQLSKDRKYNGKVNHLSTKTNLDLNYDKEKILILEMETDNHEAKDKLIITSSGLIGSLRTKTSNFDESSVYFGYKEQENYIVNIFIIFYMHLLIIGRKN